MHRITSKLNIIMLLTILMVGCTTSSTSTTQYPTTRRLRHQRSTHASSERNFARNADLLRSWKCGTPKPRVVHLTEAIGGEPSIPPNMLWPIKAALLYRCENTLGCCDDGKSCTPAESETVTITFKEMNAHTAATSYKYLEFTNHTRCSCT